MEERLQYLANHVGLTIEAIAIIVVAAGVVGAVIGTCKVMVFTRASDTQRRNVWLTFAQWLIAGLTFQLAADIVQTTVAPSWDQVGKLAATAAIRTFLTYFLDRDVETMRLRQRETAPADAQHAQRS